MASARWPTGSQSSLGHITETGLNLRYITLNTCIPMAVSKSTWHQMEVANCSVKLEIYVNMTNLSNSLVCNRVRSCEKHVFRTKRPSSLQYLQPISTKYVVTLTLTLHSAHDQLTLCITGSTCSVQFSSTCAVYDSSVVSVRQAAKLSAHIAT